MERSEPTLVPGWLKSSGSINGSGTSNHQFVSSSFHSDDHALTKSGRNKSTVNISDHDLGRSSASDRTTSSYFRRSSSSNGSSHLRSYGSFGGNHRDRDWDKDIYDYRDKEKSILGDHRHHDYSDPLGNILPSMYEKDGLRRSQSMVPGKRGETLPRKTAAESSNANKNGQNSGGGVLAGGSPIRSVHKAVFERDFPSLGTEERQTAREIGRVPSPGLSTAIQNLPVGTSVVIGGDGWTSALAKVPVIVGSNGTSTSSVQLVPPAPAASVASSAMTGLNMAETLAQGPYRAPTTPQSSAETHRLEELAIKQSRQLIPVTPSMPKALALNPSDKAKPKAGQQQISSSQLVNTSPRGGPVKSDVSKASTMGKLHVLKPVRERNGVSPVAKDSSSPASSSKVANSSLAATSSVVGPVSLRSPSSNPVLASSERKPALSILERRPASQTQSRNDFFNLMRKKSMTNSSAAPDSSPASSSSDLDKPSEIELPALSPAADAASSQGRDASLLDTSGGEHSTENRGDLVPSGDVHDGSHKSSLDNGKKHPSSNTFLYSEEEETAFLRSLGWEEHAGEDEGLTEEEISSFYRDNKHISSRPSSRVFQGMQPKFLPPNFHIGSNGWSVSSGLSSSDSKLES